MFSDRCKSILITRISPTGEAHEAAFNRYYEEVHIPDVLEARGVLAAHRFERIGRSDDAGKYLALLELDSADPMAVWKGIRAVLAEKRAGPGHAFAEATVRYAGVYLRRLRLEDQSRPPGAVTGLALRYYTPADPAEIPAMLRWYATVHFPDALATPGFHAVDLLEAVDPNDEYRFLNVYQIDATDIRSAFKAAQIAGQTWRERGRMVDYTTKQTGALFQRHLPHRISAFLVARAIVDQGGGPPNPP